MTEEKIMTWVRAERLGLADLLDGLDEHEWQVASLCPGWTVRDVAAHLTLSTRTTRLATIAGAVRARGDFNRMTGDAARRRAARYAPAELIAQLRQTAGSPRRAPGAGPMDPLVDALVHGQDIARPLGRVRPMPPAPAVAALDHVRNTRFYGGRRRFQKMHLVATDVTWQAGDGPYELRGPLSDLLLVATGRGAGLAGLSGPGAEQLATTLQPDPR
jgi:uncharacterized protein (TIGR03083 family)